MPDQQVCILDSRKTSCFHVGVIGGGIAGSTIALRLAELGIRTTIFEQGPSLVNGPPICHLHAGGNLYREISDEQCIKLLIQSINTVRVYPHTVNIRPTAIIVPTIDPGDPNCLISRLTLIRKHYKNLVQSDPLNEVLGSPEEYFKLYSKQELQDLVLKQQPTNRPTTLDDWMIPVAKNINLDQVKYPVILVQEYGWSVFRLASSVSLAFENLPSCSVLTNTKVTNIESLTNGWKISYQTSTKQSEINSINEEQSLNVNYLVNACGFRTGIIDDFLHLSRERMVEFKAAYVAHWANCSNSIFWPEVIFHGVRGTPTGMAQLTPYPDGYFQLHGMTNDITLFEHGLVRSSTSSAQPQLESHFLTKLEDKWESSEIKQRTERAIQHLSQFLPAFSSATVGGIPLFGAQQIPGGDPTLRAADVSFSGERYARSEIVKGSSAITVADAIVKQLCESNMIDSQLFDLYTTPESCFPVTHSLTAQDVTKHAEILAEQRNYPTALARPVL